MELLNKLIDDKEKNRIKDDEDDDSIDDSEENNKNKNEIIKDKKEKKEQNLLSEIHTDVINVPSKFQSTYYQLESIMQPYMDGFNNYIFFVLISLETIALFGHTRTQR